MTVRRPPRQLCPLCAQDDDIDVGFVDGVWVMTCSAPEHPPFVWTPRGQGEEPRRGRTGVSEDLGVYDDLLHCVAEGFAEHGVLEYRFWQLAPATYTTL